MYPIKFRSVFLLRLTILLVSVLLCNVAPATTITVNTGLNNGGGGFADDGLCSIYEAVEAANTNSPSGTLPGECLAGEALPVMDEIVFDRDILPIIIDIDTTLELQESVQLDGLHQNLVTLSGIGLDRVMSISNVAVADFIISDLTIQNGLADEFSNVTGVGGGIWARISASTLLIERVNFTGNTARYAGGALALSTGIDSVTTIKNCRFRSNLVFDSSVTTANHGGGGAIYVAGDQELVIEGSSFIDNIADTDNASDPDLEAAGGAVFMVAGQSSSSSEVTIRHSTFSGNQAAGAGGAIANGRPDLVNNFVDLSISHATILLNTSDSNNNQQTASGRGGGIYNGGVGSDPINLLNTIVAANDDLSDTPARNLTGGFNTFGFNWISNNSGSMADFPLGVPNINNDFVGTSLLPNLLPLGDYGGPTLTHGVDISSGVVDQGRCSVQIVDQRGYHDDLTGFRPIDIDTVSNLDDGCDIGAVELGASALNRVPEPSTDAFEVMEDRVLVLSGEQGVLQNDNDDSFILVVSNAGEIIPDSTNMTDSGELILYSDGGLEYRPAADEFGVATTVYRVSDRLNTVSETIILTVRAINDAPSFTAASQAITETSSGSPVTISGWADDILAGPDNESQQILEFVITPVSGTAGFFSQSPTIDDSSGDLTYTLAAGTSGFAEMEVVLTDDGGSGVGIGEDQSVPVILTISLNQNAPMVDLTSPADGDQFNAGDLIAFAATAADVEDGDLTADLVWQSDLDGNIGNGGSFSSSSLSVGTHRVRARVIDSSGLPGQASIEILVQPTMTEPEVIINAPATGSIIDEGESIDFEALADDAEDGDLSADIVWHSNVDGQLGTGASIQASTLRPGSHLVTARVRDSDNQAGSDNIVVLIVEAGPEAFFRDGFENMGQ